jgi:hypothetical protein
MISNGRCQSGGCITGAENECLLQSVEWLKALFREGEQGIFRQKMREGLSNLREILNESSIKPCMSQKIVNFLHIGGRRKSEVDHPIWWTLVAAIPNSDAEYPLRLLPSAFFHLGVANFGLPPWLMAAPLLCSPLDTKGRRWIREGVWSVFFWPS